MIWSVTIPSVFPSSATLKPIFWMSIVNELLASRVTVNVAVPVVRLIRFEYSVDPACDAHHELHREGAVAPLEAPLDLVAILRSRAGEEAGPEVVLPGRFHGHELLGAAAGEVVDAVERQRGDHAGIEFMRRRRRRAA